MLKNLKKSLALSFFGDTIKQEVTKAKEEIVRSSRQILPLITAQEKEKGIEPDVTEEVLWETYLSESWVRAIVDLIQKSCVALGYTLTPLSDKADQNHLIELDAFFKNCNPNDTIMEMVSDISRDISILSKAFMEIVKKDKKPYQLWSLDPISMRVKQNETGRILGYRQEANKGSKDPQWGPDEIIYWRLGTRGSKAMSNSPLITLATSITVDKYAQIYNKAFFQHGAKAKGHYVMKDQPLEVVERNREYLKSVAEKPELAHMDLVFEGDIEYEKTGESHKDMEFGEDRKFIRDEILAVYGCPPSLISIIESGNIGAGTGETQIKNFYEQTIIPLQRRIENKITKKVIKEGFGYDDWAFELRKRKVAEKEMAEILKILVDANILTPEEARLYSGYPPRKAVESLEKKLALRVRGIPSLEERFENALKRLLKRFAEAGKRQLEKLPLAKMFSVLKDAEYENRIYESQFNEYIFELHKFPVKEKQLNIDAILETIKEEDVKEELSRFMQEAGEFGASTGNKKLGTKAVLSATTLERIDVYLTDLAKYLKETIDSSVRHEIVEGIRAGETTAEISARVESALDKPIKHTINPKARAAYTKRYKYSATAELIARTEVNRAFNMGMVDVFKQAEIKKVKILLSPDACPECQPFRNKVVNLDEASQILPIHHQCRCTFISAE